jgi:shikimate kinase
LSSLENFDQTRATPIDSDPRLIFLIGTSGSGKSVIGALAAAQLGWLLLDTDVEILAGTGLSDISSVFDANGERWFRSQEAEIVRRLAESSRPTIVATGGGLPAIEGMMSELNAIGVTIYLRAQVETLWERLLVDPNGVNNRPLLKEGGISRLAELDLKRRAIYSQAAIILDTDALSAEAVAKQVVAYGS